MTTPTPVVVVGAGIAGVACARVLHDAGVAVTVLDRGKAPGGRMASRTVQGRRVDIGASYFTVNSDAFAAVVRDWEARGLAHAWTNTFHVATAAGLGAPKTGPVRYGTPAGLRSLVVDLAAGLDLRSDVDVAEVGPGLNVDGVPAAAVVLAMPDPQALDLLHPHLEADVAAIRGRGWSPALALYAGWAQRSWPDFAGAFVADHPVLEWIADDGARRGDGAAVLVAHSGAAFAAPHLDDPQAALPAMLAAVQEVLGMGDPAWARLQRWSLARPLESREEMFHLGDSGVGLCGDGWGSAKVETAYLSGRDLGLALLARLKS